MLGLESRTEGNSSRCSGVPVAAALSRLQGPSLEGPAGVLGFLPPPHKHWGHALWSVSPGKGTGKVSRKGGSATPAVREPSTIFHPKLDADASACFQMLPNH